jgi:hypothetical protein
MESTTVPLEPTAPGLSHDASNKAEDQAGTNDKGEGLGVGLRLFIDKWIGKKLSERVHFRPTKHFLATAIQQTNIIKFCSMASAWNCSQNP